MFPPPPGPPFRTYSRVCNTHPYTDRTLTENVIICVRLPAIGRRRALLTPGVSRFRFYYYLTNENNARRGSDVFKTERDHFRSDRNQKRQLQLFYVRQSSREGRAFIHETVRRRSLHVPRKFSAEFFALFLFVFYGRRNSASPAGNRTNCPLHPNRQPQTYYTSVLSVVVKRTRYIVTNERKIPSRLCCAIWPFRNFEAFLRIVRL